MAVGGDHRGELAVAYGLDVVGDARQVLGRRRPARQLGGAEVDEHVTPLARRVHEGHEEAVAETDLVGADLYGGGLGRHAHQPSAAKRRASIARCRCSAESRSGEKRAPSALARSRPASHRCCRRVVCRLPKTSLCTWYLSLPYSSKISTPPP